MNKRAKKSKRHRISYLWHRRIGVIAALPVLFLSITGMILNNSQPLGLDNISITNQQIVKWYGMTPSESPVAINHKETWVATLENILFVNGQEVAKNSKKLTGVTDSETGLVIATTEAIYIWDKDEGILVEQIAGAALPSGSILALQNNSERILLDTTSGQYSFDLALTSFQKDNRSPLPSFSPQTLPKNIYDQIIETWRGNGLTLWRVLLDIHSGAFFGGAGKWLTDVWSILLVILVMSGIYQWRLTKK